MSIYSVNSSMSLNAINSTSNTISKSMQKIASGSQYNSAADGASAYSILTRMYSNIGTLSQSNENTQTMNAMMSTASGGVDSTVTALSSLKDKLLQAANGTNNSSDIGALQKEVDQTVSQIDENAGITFNNQGLLDGTKTLTVAGDNGYKNIALGDMSSQGLGLTDANGDSTLDLSTSKGVASALDTVSAALDTALSQSTNIGSVQQGLSYSSSNYISQTENLTNAASGMGDTDIAAEVTKLKSSQTVQAFALYAAKLNMHDNMGVLALLR
ncbi:MAG: flagellin [Selenomonadaceae bacterium]